MKPRRVLFLDIDGVLNHSRLYAVNSGRIGQTTPADWIDRDCVTRINAVCERTGAVIVISSSWREYQPTPAFPGAEAVLRECGLAALVIGGTPVIEDMLTIVERDGTRFTEIRAWLDANPEVSDWAAVDDCDWRGFPDGRFVRTDIRVGITDADADALVSILGGDDL